MVFVRTTLEEGDSVITLTRLENSKGYFTAGHQFKIVGRSVRGWNLRDGEGNVIVDVPFSSVKKYEGDQMYDYYSYDR